MKQLPKNLLAKLEKRKSDNTYRELSSQNRLIDFSSNDYLGFSKSRIIFNQTHQFLIDNKVLQNGATGSRLLSGNTILHEKVETKICEFHNSKSALIFNSGYDANLGFFSSIPQKDDFIFYDELCHASIRDGIRLSHAKAYKFQHNNLEDLKGIFRRIQHKNVDIYIVTESVFSMDGDAPNLHLLCEFCNQNNYHLIVDEAHAVGIFGNGKGLIQELNLENRIFARLITFGKALGCHGAAILGHNSLKTYLINFARSFIYTTALPPHTLATIHKAYEQLSDSPEIEKLHHNIQFFKSEIHRLKLDSRFVDSNSAIQSCIISGNTNVKSAAMKLQKEGFDVKPILSPTVPQTKERLRFCLHSYNSEVEITKVLELLATFATKVLDE